MDKPTNTHTHSTSHLNLAELLIFCRDQGIPSNKNDNILRRLAKHLLSIVIYVKEERWGEACGALYDDTFCQECGIQIDTPFKVFDSIDDAVSFTRRSTLWFKTKKKLQLPLPIIGQRKLSSDFWKYPMEVRPLAEKISPIIFEAWLDCFQFFLADGTKNSSTVCTGG